MNSNRLAGGARRVRVAVYLLTGLALGSGAAALAQEAGQESEIPSGDHPPAPRADHQGSRFCTKSAYGRLSA